MTTDEQKTENNTTVVTVRTVPTSLHNELRVLAAQEKKTVAELMVEGAYMRVADGVKTKLTQAELVARYDKAVPNLEAVGDADQFFSAIRAETTIE